MARLELRRAEAALDAEAARLAELDERLLESGRASVRDRELREAAEAEVATLKARLEDQLSLAKEEADAQCVVAAPPVFLRRADRPPDYSRPDPLINLTSKPILIPPTADANPNTNTNRAQAPPAFRRVQRRGQRRRRRQEAGGGGGGEGCRA